MGTHRDGMMAVSDPKHSGILAAGATGLKQYNRGLRAVKSGAWGRRGGVCGWPLMFVACIHGADIPVVVRRCSPNDGVGSRPSMPVATCFSWRSREIPAHTVTVVPAMRGPPTLLAVVVGIIHQTVFALHGVASMPCRYMTGWPPGSPCKDGRLISMAKIRVAVSPELGMRGLRGEVLDRF